MVHKNGKKKIVYVITKSNWGGAQKYVYDLATNVGKTNYDVVVALGGNGRLKSELENAGIKVITINRLGRDIKIRDEIAVFINLLNIFRKERPDIVHLNSPKIGGIGALAGRFSNVKKIIYTAHGWTWNEDRGGFQKILIKFLSWLTILLSHKTIAVSKYDLSACSNMPFINKKIVVVYNGISKIDLFDKDTARKILISKIGTTTGDDTIWLGAIGELHKNKGFDYAIEAFSLLLNDKNSPKNLLFLIIGDGEEKKNLENLIKTKSLGKNVFITSSEKKAAELLKAFDILLLPSVKEGLPYLALEAGYAKSAIIASKVGGVPEIIENMRSGILLRPRDPVAMMKSIMWIIDNEDKRYKFGEKLKEKVLKDFRMDKMIINTLNIYTSL